MIDKEIVDRIVKLEEDVAFLLRWFDKMKMHAQEAAEEAERLWGKKEIEKAINKEE